MLNLGYSSTSIANRLNYDKLAIVSMPLVEGIVLLGQSQSGA